MSLNWNNVKPACCANWLVLPTVYSDTLSYSEQLDKFCYQLNQLIENNNILPDFIAEMIKEYINSGAIGEVVKDILSVYILNVKYPPKGITPAVGDGSADDTAAIQGCIDYAAENGGVVYFPYGSYLTQPLTMKDGVSLFGFDRYSTKIVLKGGATKPLIGGTVADFSIANLTLDGNSGIQVNDVNVVTIIGTNVLFTNLIIKDGYTLVNYVGTSGHFQISDVVFGNAVEKCLLTAGNADVQCENVVFNQLSTAGGISVMDIGTDGGFFNVKSVATCNQCIVVGGNKNKISAIVENASIPVVDNGLQNNVEIFGVSNKEYYSGNTEKEVGGNYSKHVAGAYTKAIDGNSNESVDGNKSEIVSGTTTETYNGLRTITEGDVNIKHSKKVIDGIETWVKSGITRIGAALNNAINNLISPTVMYTNKTNNKITAVNDDKTVTEYIGTEATNNGSDKFAHNPASLLTESKAHGVGTFIDTLHNIVGDNNGSVIGLASFARKTEGSSDDDGTIITGLWGYPSTPHENESKDINCSICGLELNMQIDVPDVGYKDYLEGYYSSVGVLLSNYRTPNTGRQNWTFGEVIQGTPVNGDYTDIDIENWNAIHTGISINHILEKGILFNNMIKDGGYGIYFPDVLANNAHVTGLYLGGTTLNLGTFTGTGKDLELWQNGNKIWFKPSGENPRALLISYTDSTIGGYNLTFQELESVAKDDSIFLLKGNLNFRKNGVARKFVFDNDTQFFNANGVTPVENNKQALGNPDLYWLSLYTNYIISSKTDLMESVATKFGISIADKDVDVLNLILTALTKCTVQS